MKLDILFVHFAVVAAVAIPYILFILAAARQRKHLTQRFNKEAGDLGIKPDQVDRWNANIIGFDKTAQKILLVQRRREEISVQVANLKNVRSCVLLHQISSVKINKKNEDVLQKVELELNMFSGEKQIISLFDCNVTYSQDYEMKNAEKWNQIINTALGVRPLIHSAA